MSDFAVSADIIEKSCVTMRHGDKLEKERLGLSWRYIIRAGIKHVNTCIPREETIALSYDRARRATEYAKIIHKLRTQYPKVWDAIINEQRGEVNGSTRTKNS